MFIGTMLSKRLIIKLYRFGFINFKSPSSISISKEYVSNNSIIKGLTVLSGVACKKVRVNCLEG